MAMKFPLSNNEAARPAALRRRDAPAPLSEQDFDDLTRLAAQGDVSARREAEERLKRSEEWLRAIFEASRDGILVEDNESIVYVNKSYTRLLGYDEPEELIGCHISMLLSSEDRDQMLSFGSRRLRGESPPPVYEFKGRCKDGTSIALEASVSTHAIGGKTYITTAIRDIADRKRAEAALRQAHDELERRVTERTAELAKTNAELQAEILVRQRAEETLRESEQRLHIAIQASKLGSWQLDLAGGELTSSDTCKANFGLPPDADLSYESLLASIHTEDRERVRAAVQRAIESHIDYEAEYRIIWPDGSTHWITARGRCVYGADGQPLRMIGVTLDVTERKLAEEVRGLLLQQLVMAQEEERRRIALELHDQIGQDLTAVIIGLKSLRASAPWEGADAARLSQLQELTERLGLKMHNLAWELRPTALDDLGLHTALYNFVEEWSDRAQVMIDFQSIGLDERRLPPQVETTLYRIVQEALTNVLKHAGASNVSLILERRRDLVSAIVDDDGKGFDVKAALNAPTKERRLGLLGMKERAGLVGGSLNIESTPGVGTTVFVRVPLAPDQG